VQAAIQRLIEEHRHDPRSGWSMGTIGAVAEFVWDQGEPVTHTLDSTVTPRGGIRLAPPAKLRAVAYETPAGPHDHWNHTVALCLPAAAARRHARDVVTELGPDTTALRAADRAAVLFDLGLGTPSVDVCVRSADPALLDRLRAAEGRSLFSPGSTLAGEVAAAGPHRVFATACGRVEVYAAIPPPDGRSPDGPHTHLLPHLMRPGRTHPATAPIPPGLLPCAHLYPPHPTTEPNGTPIPFDHARHRAFQYLLARYGDAGQARVKAATVEAVRAGRTPHQAPGTPGPPERAALAVALRQLSHTDGPSTALAAWRDLHRPADAVLDPAGDRNGG
jgi:hypothetical protein